MTKLILSSFVSGYKKQKPVMNRHACSILRKISIILSILKSTGIWKISPLSPLFAPKLSSLPASSPTILSIPLKPKPKELLKRELLSPNGKKKLNYKASIRKIHITCAPILIRPSITPISPENTIKRCKIATSCPIFVMLPLWTTAFAMNTPNCTEPY